MSAQRWDDIHQAISALSAKSYASWEGYFGFYSSWLGGYFREPWAMLLPLDDHGFHRGDAVFEAARLQQGAYFDLGTHLTRLERSAASIGMELPRSKAEIEAICIELARRCQVKDGLLRLYVTRGPGGFSPSPKEVVGHQIYAALTKLKLPSPELYSRGCSAMISEVPAKEPFWAQIKSCNYLPNVLMKKECLDRGVDFAIGVDAQGRVCEGSTENIMLVTSSLELIVPNFDYTLRGTTVRVVMRLAEDLVRSGGLRTVRLGDIQRSDLLGAREAAFVGTTLGVLPLTQVDGQAIGDGRPGPIAQALNQALQRMMSSGFEMRTLIESTGT